MASHLLNSMFLLLFRFSMCLVKQFKLPCGAWKSSVLNTLLEIQNLNFMPIQNSTLGIFSK